MPVGSPQRHVNRFAKSKQNNVTHSALVQATLIAHQVLGDFNSQEILGFKTSHSYVGPMSSLFTCPCFSSFIYVNEYMTIDIGGHSLLM